MTTLNPDFPDGVVFEGKLPKRPHRRVSVDFVLPTRTRHSETAATDLKSIVARYQKVGSLPPMDMQFGDVSELPTDRLEAMEIMAAAAAAFADLPFKVRQAINHDPRLLEQWIVGNPAQAREYGLLAPLPQQASPPKAPSSSGTDEGEKERKKPLKASEAGESV